MTTFASFTGSVHVLGAMSPSGLAAPAAVAQHDLGGVLVLLFLGAGLVAVIRAVFALVRALLTVLAVIMLLSFGLQSRPSASAPRPTVQQSRSVAPHARPIPPPAARRTTPRPAPSCTPDRTVAPAPAGLGPVTATRARTG